MTPRSSRRAALYVLAVAGVAASCERAPESRREATSIAAVTGTALVVGLGAQEWGLLVLPLDGGRASLRTLETPDVPVIERSTRLPGIREVRRLGGALLALQASDGRILRYDAARDSLFEVGRMGDGRVLLSSSDEGVVASSPGGTGVIAMSGERTWQHQAPGPLLWAGAVHDGVAVLVAGAKPAEEPILSVIPNGDAASPASVTGRVPVAPPGLVVAWGRRLAFPEAGDRTALRVLAVESLDTVGRVELGGRLTALASSPSSHEIYAGMEDPPRIVAVNRFSFQVRRVTALPAVPIEIRPSLFGEALLVTDGTTTWRVPVSGGVATEIPGTWSGDLPIGLPDGAVLARTEQGVVRVGPGAARRPVDAPADAWWVPVRWMPAALGADDDASVLLPSVPGRRAAGGQDLADEPAANGADADSSDVRAEGGPPPGYYAIVGSARQRDGIDRLVEDLATAGFPVQVQSVPDLAGMIWHRGLVGPYDTRPEADAAARQLQRERRLQSWVTGIGSDG